MTDGNGETQTVGDFLLEQLLKEARTGAIAATAIGFDEQGVGVGKVEGQLGFTPAHDVVHGKGRGISGLTDIDRARVMVQVINAIGDSSSAGGGRKVMDVDFFSAGAPSAPRVLEVADQFFLFRIDTDGWLASGHVLGALRHNVSELFVALGSVLPFPLLDVERQALIMGVQKPTDDRQADAMTLLSQTYLEVV